MIRPFSTRYKDFFPQFSYLKNRGARVAGLPMESLLATLVDSGVGLKGYALPSGSDK